LEAPGFCDTFSNAPTKAAAIPSFAAESKIIIEAKAPSIIL